MSRPTDEFLAFIRTFRRQETDTFLDTHCGYDLAKKYLVDMKRAELPWVRIMTREGLDDSVDAFLQQQDASHLYIPSVLRLFATEHKTPMYLARKLNMLSRPLPGADRYAEDVGNAYAVFCHNDSVSRLERIPSQFRAQLAEPSPMP
ncbi:MAG: hypothetical protein AABY13_00730 [Nanoarchaeota archaeon]